MKSFNTNEHEFCLKWKSFFMTGCLIFALLISHASCRRPSEKDDVGTYNDGDYTDADDIEWQNFPIAETTTKDHPIIYYKEDIVSEDYDPYKENKSSSKEEEKTDINPPPKRKYKNILRRNRLNRTESYRYIKPEKVYFDVYPIEDDGAKGYDTELNAKDISVEIISLVDDKKTNSDEENSDSKRLLNKRPKKYYRRHRQRRDVTPDAEVTDENPSHALRHKRNPFSIRFSYYGNQLPFYHGVFHQPQVIFYPTKRVKYPTKGVYYNAGSPSTGIVRPTQRVTTTTTRGPPTDQMPDIVNRIGEPIWDSSPMTTPRAELAPRPPMPVATRPPRRPPPPIIHSGDEDYVPPPVVELPNTNSIPSRARTTTLAPNLDFGGSAFSGQWTPQMSFAPAAPFRPAQTTTTPPPPAVRQEPESSTLISTCIWAISSCCTRTESISYRCFERLGCSGAFWDLNPCAEDIYRLAVNAADQYLS